ncbi:hypothetical protein D3C78_1381850 [compost metagenome]
MLKKCRWPTLWTLNGVTAQSLQIIVKKPKGSLNVNGKKNLSIVSSKNCGLLAEIASLSGTLMNGAMIRVTGSALMEMKTGNLEKMA